MAFAMGEVSKSRSSRHGLSGVTYQYTPQSFITVRVPIEAQSASPSIASPLTPVYDYERSTSSSSGKGTSHRVTISSSVAKGVLIGMLSAFGAALFIIIVLGLVYLLRYTTRGRIFLDRIGRPGEYDDEQAFAKEEAEALES